MKLSICQCERRERGLAGGVVIFFSLSGRARFLSSGAQGKLIFYVRSIKLWGSREIFREKMITILAR
jgi:hypothetical protein